MAAKIPFPYHPANKFHAGVKARFEVEAETPQSIDLLTEKVDSSSKNQNPPGYRGMERPANALPADSGSGAKADTTAPADATSRINQRARQDSSSGTGQNPPGYRGMERPAGLDTARAVGNQDSVSQNNSGDTTRADTAQ